MEHSPASLEVGLRWHTTSSQWGGEGFEGWSNSPNKAAIGMGGPRQRKTLSGQQEASQLFLFFSTAGQENSSERQTWIVCQRDLAPPPPPLFLVWPHPLAAPNRRSTGWLSRDSEPPLSASYLAVPHSFLPPLWLLHHPSPSIAESFCFVSPRGGVRLSNGATKMAGCAGEREWAIEMKNRLCRQSKTLPSPGPSSSSQRGILLDLLPHTISTDHAHYVFNSSILCKTG